jgi:GT2 family glycosyltransferase
VANACSIFSLLFFARLCDFAPLRQKLEAMPLPRTLLESSTTLIIPQFHRPDLTLACIRSFQSAHGAATPILVIDDGSDAPSLRTLQSARLPATQIVPQPHRGLTAAWNNGLARADTRWLVFLNNDVTTHGPWLPSLLEPIESGRALMTGVRLRTEQRLPPDLLNRLPARRVLAGWCFAISRDHLLHLGGFDESFRLYFSDTDLQLRLIESHSADSPLLAVPGLTLTHAAHATTRSTNARRRLWRHDRDRFIAKWTKRPPHSAETLLRASSVPSP